LNPDRDPWAQHAIGHAIVAMGQPVEARAFLHSVSHSWDRCSSFMLTHNWWHLALLELELGNIGGALALFDERVWGVRKGHVQDQVNAISLLARLAMHGGRLGWRWDDVASHVEDRVTDRISPFLDLHYLIALINAGRDGAARRLTDALQCDGVAGALAKGILFHANQDYAQAAAVLAPVCPRLCDIGGSNIQRELFESIFIDSVNRARRDITLIDQGDYRVAA
ncbi:MAG: hypothetical protein RL367_2525, partial [Pseudomonadota bacterium]